MQVRATLPRLWAGPYRTLAHQGETQRALDAGARGLPGIPHSWPWKEPSALRLLGEDSVNREAVLKPSTLLHKGENSVSTDAPAPAFRTAASGRVQRQHCSTGSSLPTLRRQSGSRAEESHNFPHCGVRDGTASELRHQLKLLRTAASGSRLASALRRELRLSAIPFQASGTFCVSGDSPSPGALLCRFPGKALTPALSPNTQLLHRRLEFPPRVRSCKPAHASDADRKPAHASEVGHSDTRGRWPCSQPLPKLHAGDPMVRMRCNNNLCKQQTRD